MNDFELPDVLEMRVEVDCAVCGTRRRVIPHVERVYLGPTSEVCEVCDFLTGSRIRLINLNPPPEDAVTVS